jgi:hypothetical protein
MNRDSSHDHYRKFNNDIACQLGWTLMAVLIVHIVNLLFHHMYGASTGDKSNAVMARKLERTVDPDHCRVYQHTI